MPRQNKLFDELQKLIYDSKIGYIVLKESENGVIYTATHEYYIFHCSYCKCDLKIYKKHNLERHLNLDKHLDNYHNMFETLNEYYNQTNK